MRASSSGNKARRHRKVIKQAKGYRQGRSKVFSQAKNAVMRAGRHAYIDRKKKKRTFRSLWIIRINSFLKEQGIVYSRFIDSLKKNDIKIDRKILSDLATQNQDIFLSLIK